MHFKVIFAQREMQMEDAHAIYQKAVEQNEEEHRQNLKRIHEHLAQVPSTHQIQDQRNQRDLEF